MQDRWYRKQINPVTGKVERVKTDLYGKGLRHKVRYLAPDGEERSRSFPDRCKREADDFLLEVEAKKREGRFIDPRAGAVTFRAQAENWLKGQSADRATRGALRSRLESRIYPYFGKRPISSIKTGTIRDWLGQLDDHGYSQNYRSVLFTIVSSVLESAIDDRLIAVNPCKAQSIKRPGAVSPNIVVWPADRVDAVRRGLADRFRIAVTLGAGCGLRQGEILGLSPDDIDTGALVLTVRRQLRVVERQLVFALPKGGKIRTVPLASGVLDRLRSHVDDFPATAVTLPWRDPSGDPMSVRLLITGPEGRPYNGDLFNKLVWRPSFDRAEIAYRKRVDGIHALRHFYASVLLAQGVSIKELADYLGHADPGFTLRTYTHLVPSSFERARTAVDGVFPPAVTADGLDAA